MKLVIAHLYYDLMNLYGESGNVKALKKYFEEQGINVSIKFVTIDCEKEFDKYDIVYIGSGIETNRMLVLDDILKHKEEIEVAIENNKFFLCTGNSYELFGKYIEESNQKKYKALNIFDYHAEDINFRIVDQVYFRTSLISKPIIGFQNQGSVIKNNNNNLFEVITGTGNYPNSSHEGIHYKNFYGTYVIGPILVRNPHFTRYFIKQVIYSKSNRFKIKNKKDIMGEKAYNNFIDKFIENK